MTEPGLRVEATLAARGLDLALRVDPGERVAILGPNGAGKSTLLGLLAGVLRADTGRATLDGRVLFDRSRRVWAAPHTRGIALLAQDPLLFPHLDVLDNVAFGPRSAGRSTREARAAARRWLVEAGVGELAGRRPAQLSGGQAQRVAIARALAAEPRLLLLDEPLAALDVAAGPMIRRLLATVLPGRAALIVTHDLLDALLLSDRLVVLDQGRIVESGPTQQVIQRPRTPFTARIAGVNLLTGTADGPARLTDAHGLCVEGVPDAPLRPGQPAVALFAPSAVAVYVDPPHGSPRNAFAVTIAELEPRDGLVRLRCIDHDAHTLLADVTAASVAELDLYPGRAAHLQTKATAVTLYGR